MNLWSSPVGTDSLVGQQLAILAEVHRLIGPAHTHPTSHILSAHQHQLPQEHLSSTFAPTSADTQ